MSGNRSTDAWFRPSAKFFVYGYPVYRPAEGAGFVQAGASGWAVNNDISTLFIHRTALQNPHQSPQNSRKHVETTIVWTPVWFVSTIGWVYRDFTHPVCPEIAMASAEFLRSMHSGLFR